MICRNGTHYADDELTGKGHYACYFFATNRPVPVPVLNGFVRLTDLMSQEKIRQSAIMPTVVAIAKWKGKHQV